MRQYLSAQIQAANQIELDEIVDPEVIRNIKAQNPHPEIRLYSIGHEGEANLHLPGIGTKTFTWIQAAISAIADKLRIGTAVFDRHNPDTNSHTGRIQIGEVVGKMTKKIGERLNTLAAIYIYDQFKSRPLDVASFEAEIEFDHDEHQAWPTQIKDVSGIALSNSGTDQPGFPGATLFGAVQAYVQAFGNDFGGNKMNLSEVKQAAKDLGLKPSQVFEIGDIMGDSAVDAKVKEVTKDHFAMAKRIGDERDAARDKIVVLENQNAETDKKLKQHTMLSKSTSLIDAVLANPESKLNDQAKAFVKRNLKNFSTDADSEDALKVDVVKFVEATVKEYQEVATEVFGQKVEKINANPQSFTLPDNLTVAGQQSTQHETTETPVVREEILHEEMNPETNPFIPGGKAAKEALKT